MVEAVSSAQEQQQQQTPSPTLTDFSALRHRLDEAVAQGGAKEILAVLGAISDHAAEVQLLDLQKTRIGASVGKLRASPDVSVAQLAADLVARWKPLTTKRKTPSPAPAASPSTTSPPAETPELLQPASPKRRKTPEAGAGTPLPDEVRERCRAMILEALSPAMPEDKWDVAEAAEAIEKELFEMHGFVTDKLYKAHFRTIFLNLKNTVSRELRDALLFDEKQHPSRVCRMSG